MNLTDRQWNLLSILVQNDQLNGGAEFFFTLRDGGWATYGRKSVRAPGDQSDLSALQSAGALAYHRLQTGAFSGKPTQRGIDAIRHRMEARDTQQPEAPSPNSAVPERSPSSARDAAQSEARAARSQLELMQTAEGEAQRNWRLENANRRIKLGAQMLFDELAAEAWNLTRPAADSFRDRIETIVAEVKQKLNCPELESVITETCETEVAKWLKKTIRESAIRGNRQWADLRAAVADLLAQEKALLGNVTYDHLLHALGTYGAGSGEFGEWSLVGATEGVQSEYMLLATRAGVALGAPAGADLVGYFLHNVFSNLMEGDSKYLVFATIEKGGMIRYLLEATVMCCARFERIALENERHAQTSITSAPSKTAKRIDSGRRPIAREDPLTAQFPERVKWLEDRLLERGWSKSDPAQHGGPDRKTIEKILRGEAVRNDVLEKLATALTKKFGPVKALDIPQE